MFSTATRLCDPKHDLAFKRLFGCEKNKGILVHFLNDMLQGRIENPIEEVTFSNTVQGDVLDFL
jgi:hypothetical protein